MKLYDSVFESIQGNAITGLRLLVLLTLVNIIMRYIMLSIIHAATSCCKSNHDKDLSEHLMIPGSFHFTRLKKIIFSCYVFT